MAHQHIVGRSLEIVERFLKSHKGAGSLQAYKPLHNIRLLWYTLLLLQMMRMDIDVREWGCNTEKDTGHTRQSRHAIVNRRKFHCRKND